MNNLTFYIVDVFAESKFAGNQLAVIRGAASLSDREMQLIAKEMNYSETTFILSDEEREGGFDVRIFTPEEEVPFAGHPTLGTAFVIQKEILEQPADTVCLNLKVGPIPVAFQQDGKGGEVLWMRQNPPQFGKVFDPESIVEVLQISPEDLDTRFPVQEVSTGLPSLIVPLKTLDAVKRCQTDRKKYMDLVKQIDSKAILVFCPETEKRENHLHVRVFVDFFGVPEDPATGSANGNLAGYLVKHSYFGDSHIHVRVEQGYQIGRPSLLLLQAEQTDPTVDVKVGGSVILVAKGELRN